MLVLCTAALMAAHRDKWEPNEEAQCVARPERAQPGLPPYDFWLCNAARAATTFAEGISVLGDEPVEQASRTAKGEPLSRRSYEPSRGEQTGQKATASQPTWISPSGVTTCDCRRHSSILSQVSTVGKTSALMDKAYRLIAVIERFQP